MDEHCYVMAAIDGPFGKLDQLSDLMRLSEAAMTIAKLSQEFPEWKFFMVKPLEWHSQR